MKLRYEKIMNEFFLPARQVRDIREAQIIPESERKSGEPDVILKSPLGFSNMAYRKEVSQRFRNKNGTKIRFIGWRRGRVNVIESRCNMPMYAMYIPPKVSIVMNSKAGEKSIESQGMYIICPARKDGSIDRTRAFVVSTDRFKKMFKMSGSLKKNVGGIKRFKKNTKEKKKLEPKETAVAASIKREEKKIIPQVKNNTTKDKLVSETMEEKRYRVVAKIVRDKNIIGFEVLDIKTSKKFRLPREKVKELAGMKKIENIGIRSLEGKTYLFGIGIKISDLPEV